MIAMESLAEINGLCAQLAIVRGKVHEIAPEARFWVFRLEQAIRDLGVDPGTTQWPPPVAPQPPVADAVRMAA